MKKTLAVLSAVLLLLCVGAAGAADRTPLLQPGKKTLYQRVVTHPGAKLYAGPEQGAAVSRDEVRTFTVFYVYGRRGERLEVGAGLGAAEGWIDAISVTEWPQAVTMVFTDRLGRQPVLFFRDHQSLVQTCLSEDLGERIRAYNTRVQKAAEDPLPADFPVIAAEPDDEAGAVSRQRFYLLPVLAVDEQFGEATKLLRVASIDPGGEGFASAAGQNGEEPEELRTAIAFVVDTTISMKPYIEQTKRMLRGIYDKLEKSPHGEKVAFAVVAYRSNVEKSPGLEYTAKVISDFKTVNKRDELEAALRDLDEAAVSTHAFDEDAMAGVKEAADSLSWKGYASRVMLLVSDAGPLSGSDPAAATGMDPAEMADYLRARDIWLTAVHLRTPAGKQDYVSAQKAYLELSKLADAGSSYLSPDARTPSAGAAEFGRVGVALAEGYSKMVEATASGRMLARPESTKPEADPEARARQIAAVTGYAMQVHFWGTRRRNTAPAVVDAWIADADLERLSRNRQDAPVPAAQPAVLLTKNQLSDLSARLKIIIEEAERTKRTDSRDFFESIVSAAAQITRDPTQFSRKPGQNLAQMGVMNEFLEGLPYKSDVLFLREEDWYNKSTGEQTAFINRLKSRVARYEEYDKDRAGWESFGAPDPGDWVYRVPLNMLP